MLAGFSLDFLLDHLHGVARLMFNARAKAKLVALEVRIADLKKLLGLLEWNISLHGVCEVHEVTIRQEEVTNYLGFVSWINLLLIYCKAYLNISALSFLCFYLPFSPSIKTSCWIFNSLLASFQPNIRFWEVHFVMETIVTHGCTI